jgi:lipopolysaccharide biosynthesis glycosyltransferase
VEFLSCCMATTPGRRLHLRENVHVVAAADLHHLPGVAGLIASARAHSERSGSLHFHIITLNEQVHATKLALACFGHSTVNVLALPAAWLAGRVRVVANLAITGNLSSPLNFARFYLPRLLPPEIDQVLYLDADVVLQSDVHALWASGSERLRSSRLPAAAVRRPDLNFRYARYVSRCGRSEIFLTLP